MKRIFVFFWLLMVTLSAYAQVSTYIPPQAFQFKDIIKSEIQTYWPELPRPAYVPSLIEVESCISLKHKRCFNQYSQLKTSREEGAGLGQLTRAYNPDGSIRFDSLKAMADQYKYELKGMSWDNIYERVDYQIRAIILMSRDNYRAFNTIKDEESRIAFTDGAYNYGRAGIQKDRKLCGLKAGCDPDLWFDNVEHTCSKPRKKIYGNRDACDISREHVKHVVRIRYPKYAENYFK